VLRNVLGVFIVAILTSACGGGSGEESANPFFGNIPSENKTPEPVPAPINSLPIISGLPTSNVEVMFGVEVNLPVLILDPDGDNLVIKLKGAPPWLFYDGPNRVLSGTPDKLEDFETVFFTVSDGEGEVISDSFSISILEPEFITLNLPIPPNTSVGDSYTLTGYLSGEVSVVNSIIIADDGRAMFDIPYDPKDTPWENTLLVLTWEHTNYVEYGKIVDNIDNVYSQLNENLVVAPDYLSSWVPDPMSSAYLHLLANYAASSDVTPTSDITQIYNQSITSSSLEELASYYELAHKNGDLFGLNKTLTDNKSTIRTDAIFSSLLQDSVNTVRLAFSSGIGNVYWNALINEASDVVLSLDYSRNWKPGVYVISAPVSVNYGSGNGIVITLNADGSYRTYSESSRSVDFPSHGNFTLNKDEIRLSIPSTSYSQDGNYIVDVVNDPLILANTIELLGVPYVDAINWAKIAIEIGLEKMTLSPVGEVYLAITDAYIFNDEESASFITTRLDIEFLESELISSRNFVNQSVNIMPVENSVLKNWEFRNEFHDIVLPMPSENGSFLPDQSVWIDLFETTSVRFRNVDSNQQPNIISKWSWSYSEEKSEFIFYQTNEDDVLVEYIVSIVDTGSLNLEHKNDLNGRVYGARATLKIDNDTAFDGLINLVIHPKSRCEDLSGEYCSLNNMTNTNTIWYDVNMGEYSPVLTNAGIIGMVNNGEFDTAGEEVIKGFIPVVLGTDCSGTIPVCFVSNGDFIIASSTSYLNREWLVGTQVWWPINLNNDDATILVDGKIKHYEGVKLDSLAGKVGFEEYWSGSLLNPLNQISPTVQP
jgi:hypothetical protein